MSDQPREILHAVTRRLDDTADLLDAAMEQATALERSLRKHEYAINDLHWDTAKILLDPNPDRPSLRAVQAGAEQLAEQLRHSTPTAVQIHETLRAAGQHLQHTDRLIGALAGTSDSVDHAAEVGILSSRAERLTPWSNSPHPWRTAPGSSSSPPTTPSTMSRPPAPSEVGTSFRCSGPSTTASSTPPERSPAPAPVPATAAS